MLGVATFFWLVSLVVMTVYYLWTGSFIFTLFPFPVDWTLSVAFAILTVYLIKKLMI